MIPLLAELCAGTGAISLALEHGAAPWRSQAGAKVKYAPAILRVMRLAPAGRAAHYLLAEADPGRALLLAAQVRPGALASAASLVEAWTSCPMGERAPRGTCEGETCPRCRGTGRWVAEDLWRACKVARGEDAGRWLGRAPGEVHVVEANHVRLDPERVAAEVIYQAGWHPGGGGFRGLHLRRPHDEGLVPSRTALPGRLRALDLPWPRVTLASSALVDPQRLRLRGLGLARIYIDPPYATRAEYKHDLNRAQVCVVAELWASLGASVYVSEAEPVSELAGWSIADVTGSRTGQVRRRDTREFVTYYESAALRRTP